MDLERSRLRLAAGALIDLSERGGVPRNAPGAFMELLLEQGFPCDGLALRNTAVRRFQGPLHMALAAVVSAEGEGYPDGRPVHFPAELDGGHEVP